MKQSLEVRFNLFDYKILGLDEAGRGNLAGPLVVAGCILNLNELDEDLILKINDSKKLSKINRKNLVSKIKKISTYAIEVIPVSIINKLGPKKCSLLGMEKIIEKLKDQCDFVFVDFERPKTNKKLVSFIHGDAKSINIAAASILAKTFKDDLMEKFVLDHPQYSTYDFINNAGYGTKKHLLALQTYGIIEDFHRINYAPVKAILQKKK